MYFSVVFVTEIAKVRASLFQVNGVKKDPLVLPEAQGQPTTLTEKVFVPVREHPDVSNHCLTATHMADMYIIIRIDTYIDLFSSC